ncbi:MAG: S8/S53 family peptidase [candidate division Zixibacteria bacterium]|nr:S8/S53 family peptidase [candidate division Zixibacteria bacterium]
MIIRHSVFIVVVASAVAGGSLLSCNSSDSPSGPTDQSGGNNNAQGSLLTGADSAPALSGTSDIGPFVVPESEVAGDFITSRLEGVINPAATIGVVNATLDSIGALISCMRTGLPKVELVVAPIADSAAAAAVCSVLVESGGFLSAYPCWIPVAPDDGYATWDAPIGGVATYLEEARFPAAWNARDLAVANASPATVLVADHFVNFTANQEIPSQTFIAGGGTPETGVDTLGLAGGNHGFAVGGVIGANFDDVGATGVFPGPSNLLRLPCFSTVGFGSMTAIMAALSSHLPATGDFVLNTSFGFNGDFLRFPKQRRIEDAFSWRFLVATRQDRFLHTQSAGNEGVWSSANPNADYNSPFTLASRFDTPVQMLQGTSISSADSAHLDLVYQAGVNTNPLFGSRLKNVLCVGSSKSDGDISTFSNGPNDFRMIGEDVQIPCQVVDNRCSAGSDGTIGGVASGTSFAAPQLAGLAAYMWTLDPSLTIEQIREIFLHANVGGWVDAYKAVLSIDNSPSAGGARVRLAILDIADGSGQKGSNGSFDERDLIMYLDSITWYEAEAVAAPPPISKDHSMFDLNGDGYTGDRGGTPTTAAFDLDINTPPAYSGVIPPECSDTSFEESTVTDRDILYYYAYSDLYTGVDNVRDSLLPCGVRVLALGSEYETNVEVWTETVVSWDPVIETEIAESNHEDHGFTEGSDPVSAFGSASEMCGMSNFSGTANAQLAYFVASGDLITGLSASVQTEETNQTPDDSTCASGYASADANISAGFQVVGNPVGFTASVSTSYGGSGRASAEFFGPTALIVGAYTGETGQASGVLQPGNYGIFIRADGSGNSATVTITFSPVSGGARASVAP